MAENYRSEGRAVDLFNVTAGSALIAGSPVGILTGTSVLRHIGESVTGAPGSSGQGGNFFIGIVDENYTSTHGGNIRILTEGVFEARFTTAVVAPQVGEPAWIDSGGVVGSEFVVDAGSGAHTGEAPIGTIVGIVTGETSGTRCQVRISPLALHRIAYRSTGSSTVVTGQAAAYAGTWPVLT